MKKIVQGRYELLATKEEAIDRFREMQGLCREEISDDSNVVFSCTENGKIWIADASRMHIKSNPIYDSAISLHGEIVEEADKTYVTYFTAFSRFESILKVSFTALFVIVFFIAIIVAIAKAESTMRIIGCLIGFVLMVRQLYINANEKSCAYQDSQIMIKILEERVNAVNHWDK